MANSSQYFAIYFIESEAFATYRFAGRFGLEQIPNWLARSLVWALWMPKDPRLSDEGYSWRLDMSVLVQRVFLVPLGAWLVFIAWCLFLGLVYGQVSPLPHAFAWIAGFKLGEWSRRDSR